MTVAAIVNPTKVSDLDALRSRLTTAAEQYKLGSLTWIETTPDEFGTTPAAQAVEDEASLIIACGGDGTVRAVLAGMLHSNVPLGIIAQGTGNLLARNLEVPLETTEAIATIFGGDDRRIDVLDISLGKGHRDFSAVMCGMGWDAAMMDVSESVKARLGWGAYAVQAARTVRDHPIRMRVQVDDGPEQTFYARTCLIANVGTLIGGLELLPESAPDDGTLEVLVFEPTTSADYVRSSWGILRGHGNADDPARTLLRGRKVVVTTAKARPRQIDGALIAEGHGFVARVLPKALTVRVPHN
ncbi:MAG: diacylglycerol kinase [Actinomycetia bacterium]|nr:diacylglycerol kinase [Actinomycetes bacterium]